MMAVIQRRAEIEVRTRLAKQAAVGLIGPRHVGKTTMAQRLAAERDAVYLDPESPGDRDRLLEPRLNLDAYADRLVVLDEIHRAPETFRELRGMIDQGRLRGNRTGRFLILGSASIRMLRQSGESLAGRIAYVDLNPVDATEVPPDSGEQTRLWLRGGFPDSLLAPSDASSLAFRRDLIRTYLQRASRLSGAAFPRRRSVGFGGCWRTAKDRH